MGTGRLMRVFCYSLPDECRLVGVLRHQLPKFDDIPFTSNNSSACAVVAMENGHDLDWLADLATEHLRKHFIEGSDPGLCVVRADRIPDRLVDFGVRATGRKVTQGEAMDAAQGLVLRGLGGTNDGIIGAAAGVGLTRYGWCGRFIEYGRLRELGDPVTVADLRRAGIRALSVDRDPTVPMPDDTVHTGNWLRPSLMAGEPVLLVRRDGDAWRAVHGKQRTLRDPDLPEG
jgi:hypothetical protein